VRRGELRWGNASLPGVSRKRRPFLVVSDDVFNRNERYEKVLVVHLTTSARTDPFPWDVGLPRGTAGLPSASLAKCNEIYTLFKTQLGELLGVLAPEDLRRVDAALKISLGLG
jgi:mRNA-degrading endonuclease toxin of MazEF toxin-antitoxin module